MYKVITIIIVLVIGAAVFTGVIDVNFNAEKASDIPNTFISAITSKSTLAQIKIKATQLKRFGERYIVRDDSKKLDLALLYVQNDAQALTESINSAEFNPDTVIPQAELLLSSINYIKELSTTVPVNVIADARDDSRESFTQANNALQKLLVLQGEYEEVQQKFANIVSSIEEQMGDLGITEVSTPTVAGEVDEKSEQTEEEQPEETIPLSF